MCDILLKKRDLEWLDDLIEEDYELFMKFLDFEVYKR